MAPLCVRQWEEGCAGGGVYRIKGRKEGRGGGLESGRISPQCTPPFNTRLPPLQFLLAPLLPSPSRLCWLPSFRCDLHDGPVLQFVVVKHRGLPDLFPCKRKKLSALSHSGRVMPDESDEILWRPTCEIGDVE